MLDAMAVHTSVSGNGLGDKSKAIYRHEGEISNQGKEVGMLVSRVRDLEGSAAWENRTQQQLPIVQEVAEALAYSWFW